MQHKSVLSYVSRVSSCPMCLHALRAHVSYVPACRLRTCHYFFSCLTCLQFFTCLTCLYVLLTCLHFFTCLTYPYYLRALHALIFTCLMYFILLRTLRPFIFLRACISYVPYVSSFFLRAFIFIRAYSLFMYMLQNSHKLTNLPMVVHLCSSIKPSKTGDEEGTHLYFVNDNCINIIIQNVNSKFLSLSMYYTRCNNINSFLTLYSRTVFLFSILRTRKKLKIRQ